jgi:hypothetical protein
LEIESEEKEEKEEGRETDKHVVSQLASRIRAADCPLCVVGVAEFRPAEAGLQMRPMADSDSCEEDDSPTDK